MLLTRARDSGAARRLKLGQPNRKALMNINEERRELKKQEFLLRLEVSKNLACLKENSGTVESMSISRQNMEYAACKLAGVRTELLNLPAECLPINYPHADPLTRVVRSMKPSPSAPLTMEDHNIWCRVTWDGHLRMLHEHSTHLDRRDAGLMWWAQRHRECEEVIADDLLHSYRVHIRGPVQWLELFEIT
jgi:hypothetical protein